MDAGKLPVYTGEEIRKRLETFWNEKEPFCKEWAPGQWKIGTGNHTMYCNQAGKDMFDKALMEAFNKKSL